jgi:hypothetical protein
MTRGMSRKLMYDLPGKNCFLSWRVSEKSFADECATQQHRATHEKPGEKVNILFICG